MIHPLQMGETPSREPIPMSTARAPEIMRDDRGPITADTLLRRRARQKSDALALIDPPNRQPLARSLPRSLSYAEADNAVDAMASVFTGLGLEPGDRIALQVPNFVEAPLALLAAWRAGLTVAAVPMLWRAMELARVCDAIEPKALIGVSHFADGAPAEMLRDVAATRRSVRLVLGFGDNLPDGVVSLDDAMAARSPVATTPHWMGGPSLITFTARADAPLVPLFRFEDEILTQGAMAVLSLSLDWTDTILNAYPFTGPVGLGLGLAPWLIGGATLVQHHPFDYDTFAQQLLTSGATLTAAPGAVLDELAKDGLFGEQRCQLRNVGRVWSVPELADGARFSAITDRPSFNLYPLGDLASLLLRNETGARRVSIPNGAVRFGEDGGGTTFLETKLAGVIGDLLIRGPVVPEGRGWGPAARDANGFVATGLRGALEDGRLRIARDPALLYHGGFTIAASELDGLYQAFPGFLDAACFVLLDPIVGDRLFGAVAPSPGAPVSLEALHRFLMKRGVAPYKFPDGLVVVKHIPRDAQGHVLRDEILRQI
jgi:mycobactin salicyl-AMP ligase